MSQTKVPTKDSLTRRRVVTISDLLVKAENEDWHGVADAAMDLREIDAMLDVTQGQVHNSPDQRISHYVARTDRYEYPDGMPDHSMVKRESGGWEYRGQH